MNKIILICIVLMTAFIQAQSDTLDVEITFSPSLQTMSVKQRTVFYNNTKYPIKSLGMHAWMNAYSRRLTFLSKRKLEDRNSKLYFSQKGDRGMVEKIECSLPYELRDDEFITIPLKRSLRPGQSIEIQTDYEIQIPENFVTNYGRKETSILLKYFLLQPSKFYKDGKPEFTHYIDLETLPIRPSYYDIYINNDFEKLECNIPKISPHQFKGFRFEAITLAVNPEHLFEYNIDSTRIAINYQIDLDQQPYLEDILTRQVQFMKEKYSLNAQKLLITFKTRKLQNFTGVEDIELISKWKIKFFTAKEQIDLKMFQMLAYETLRENLNIDLEKNHWILHGLMVYMQIHYIQEFHPELKLAGHLPEDFRLGKLKPLKWFFASDLNLTDRYKLAYLYVVKQNYEQDIVLDYKDFSNVNKTIISAFKSGLGLNYMSDYIGQNHFDDLLKNFFKKHSDQFIDSHMFENYLQSNTDKDISWFFNDFVYSSDKLNFNLKKFRETTDNLLVTVENQTDFHGPFKLVGYYKDSIVHAEWKESKGHKAEYTFPLGNYDKLVVNPGYTLAEFNYRDNYLYTTGVFKNSKKVKPKLYGDIENPEYEQVFVVPSIRFNNYDKFILGARFSNYAFMNKIFKYTLSPSFSTGTTSLTGAASVAYSILPEKGIFRDITLSASSSYYHYAQDLPYFKLNAFSKFDFKKEPRSAITKSFLLSYNVIDKRPNPLDSTQNLESLKYNLFNTSFLYKDDDLIFEKYFFASLQVESHFSKLSAEWFGRYEFLYKRKLMVRWFGSTFLFNQTNTDYFSTGISRLSDYAFGYSLLARSDNTGVFSQQYVMAEGGFISKIPGRVNQWITTLRSEFPIWNKLYGYGGVGIYKNKYQDPNFIYETGFKFLLIPDFFELYFPIQSTLGFEPELGNYLSRIRFYFNFSLSALRKYFRRGWY